jgi:hypothetical protein
MAQSKKARQRAARRRQHEARARRHEQKVAAKPHPHLPHAGTPADRAYLRRRAQEDVVGFGEFQRARGPAPVIVALIVGALFALGVVAWVLLA